jgi:glycosyltransferase involved in cell wall biosynthesis
MRNGDSRNPVLLRVRGSKLSPLVSVLTPTIPGRERMLSECLQSVRSQTFPGWEHLVKLDADREGCATVMNWLAEQAEASWLLPLADDDLVLPGCLAALLEHADDADVVYAPPLVWGVDDPWWFFGEPPAIPSFALIRAELWQEIGGYDDEWTREEDRRFWTRSLERGARFVRADDAPTWIYRVHAGSKSFNNGLAS